MRTRNSEAGLPIAAHLGLLVAIAFASAFVVMLAVVIFLPPRPPDVSRGDFLVEQFALGFDEAVAGGRPYAAEGVDWRFLDAAPEAEANPRVLVLQTELARRLATTPDKVRVAAETARTDVFVFRVREVEQRARDVEARIRAFEHRIGPDAEIVIGTEDLEAPTAPGDEQVRRTFEYRIEHEQPPQAPVPPVPPAPGTPPTPPELPEPLFAPAPPGVLLLTGYNIAAQMPDGRWLSMSQGRDWEQLSWIGRAALVIGITLTALSLLALFFARRLARPIQSFAHAVEAVGVDPQREPVSEEGPRELRGAARAINTMQARLRALIADRTKMLAAVAHDMRTPLMRLRLTAENAPPENRERMAKEIGEVEALVASFIAFARDDPAEEARVRIDLTALLQSLSDDHSEAGRNVSFSGEGRVIITGQSLGLKRLFSNLIGNALKYGAAARVSLSRGDGVVIVDIADDGPGIPADQREAVFEPFVRLAQGASGAGLGLPAARGIARAHGGEIAFMDAEHGALVRVTLPG